MKEENLSPLVRFPKEFPSGTTTLVAERDPLLKPGLGFQIRVMEPRATVRELTIRETAWILLSGDADVSSGDVRARVTRGSLFDGAPTTLHVATGADVTLAARSRTEWAVVRVPNPRAFAPRLFLPSECGRENRGRGLVQGACEREVRLVFDRESRPESMLVVGEVVSLAGRWSSWPPHHHAQPEVYHYRFSHADGYGHAECGEAVFKVRSGDTLKIPPNIDHGQVAAAGYAMWYLWVVRHLPKLPYVGFEHDPAHAWMLDPAQQGWRPK